jgi:hypothetical protein
MHRSSLLSLTAFTVVLTGIVLCKAGWFRAPACPPDAPRAALDLRAGSALDGDEDAAHRYRVGGVRHWRACLIQR